jgi:hypothetical protein
LKSFPESSSLPSTRVAAIGSLTIFTSAAGLLACGVAFNAIRDRVFPGRVFAFGHGKRRFETIKLFQWGGVIAVAISVAAGIVVAYFS